MNRRILQLAIPSIISNITVPLLGLVDVAITGHMGDKRYMAAIAVASMMFNIMYWLFSFLRFGTGGMTAQSYGKKDSKECAALLFRSQATCLLVALVMVVLQVPLFKMMMYIIEPEADLLEPIQLYFSICIWGTFPSLSLYAFTGWFVGMQNTRLPMIISITQNILNISMSYLFVYHFGMMIEGVALGTLLAQWCGALIAILVIKTKYPDMVRNVNIRETIHLEKMKRFFAVNRVLFYRTLFLVAVNLYFIVAGAKGGATILAVNSVLMQLFILYSYIMDGFAFGAEALCGRYYGAQDKANFNLALRLIWRWGIGLCVLYTIAYALGGNLFVSILTDDSTVRSAAQCYLPWAALIPLCGLAAFVWDGVFVGITNTKGMLAGTFGGATAFFILYYTMYNQLGNHALWLAFNAYLLLRGVIQYIVYLAWRSGWSDLNAQRGT